MLNPTGPNSERDIQVQLSETLDIGINALDDLSIDDLTLGNASRFLGQRAALLRSTVTYIDKPILKSLATDMINLLASWFESPETLCCIIQGIWSIYMDSQAHRREDISLHLNIGETSFGTFLDTLIAFIDLIIVLLTSDLKKLIMFIPDFLKEIMKGVMGAILLLIQETLYAIRDSVLNTLIDFLQSRSFGSDSLWAKCLPLQQMLDILRKYISDFGLLATLMEKIRGWVSGLKFGWSFQAAKNLLPNIKDLEFLIWLRSLLLRLKQAAINFDLCVEYDFLTADSAPSTAAVTTDGGAGAAKDSKVYRPVSDPGTTPPSALSLDDGTIAINNEGKVPIDDQGNELGKWRARISADSIVNFGSKYMGIPREVMENAYTKVSNQDLGSLPGDNSSLLDKCPGFTRSAQFYGFTRRGKQ